MTEETSNMEETVSTEVAVDAALEAKIEELINARHAWKHKELDVIAKAQKVLVPNRGMNRADRRKALK